MTRRSQGYALVQAPESLNLTSVNRPIATYQPATVLFVDMIGFTTFCAENYPATVIEVLRDFLDLLGAQVHRHDGSVEKYLGDGLMAVFDGSSPRATDATNAVRCAIAMQQAIAAWNHTNGRHAADAIQIAIGIHSGRVIVGAIGGDTRKEVAVLGDTVNIASRVEGKCRCLDASILITSQVVEKISEEGNGGVTAIFENCGFHELRGRTGYVHLHGLGRSQQKPHERGYQ
jgi:class 3 adenylate cyclase